MPRRLIIGEENPELAGMLHSTFDERGYDVQTVDGGPALLDAARTAIPSLILVSATLPDTDPHGLIRQLRASPRAGHVPIICLASRDNYSDMLSVLETGADDCIAKPFDLDELSAWIARLNF